MLAKSKISTRWHKALYNSLSAKKVLDAQVMHVRAKQEAEFLIQEFGLMPNSRILDIPCGTGRHSKIFAQNGFRVTGVDINSECIKLAKRNCTGLSATFRVGNMNRLAWARGKFDAIINLYSSFGYFQTDEENAAVAKEWAKVLRPGGKLAIQVVNRDYLMKVFAPVRWDEDKNFFWIDAAKFDPKSKYLEDQRIMIDKSTQRAHQFYCRMRLYSAKEMITLLKKSGFSQVQVFGSAKREAFDRTKSTHPIYVATLK